MVACCQFQVLPSNQQGKESIYQYSFYQDMLILRKYSLLIQPIKALIDFGSQLICPPMQLLTTFTCFFRSRSKLLIKRRKISLKNRPISSKKLKEQQQTMNISYETKLVEIRKQLDRKKSQNHHLNQIIEDLFYPEMRMQDEKQIEMRVKQIANDAVLMGEDWEEELKADDLTQQIKENYLPVDLLRLHEQKWQEFTHKHYSALMERMSYYCHNRERIQKKMMENWERMVKKMQEKEGKNKPVKCPYLFLEREEITRHEQWTAMMKEIHRKMSQITDITAFNEYLPTLFQIQRTFNSVPADIYQLVFTRNALANFNDLTPEHISSLLKFLRYKNKVIYDPFIKISPEIEQQQASVSHLARKLATDIINHPENYTRDDFMNIFIVVNSNKKKFNILTQQLLNKSEAIVSSILNELPFDKVFTYTVIYSLFNSKPNLDFLQILKFDLYRKCDAETNYFPLLLLINRIHQRKLTFKSYHRIEQKQSVITLDGYDLLLKATEAISKMISKLKSEQLISFLNSCFTNDLHRHTAIEIISTEFVKKGKGFDLETLSKGFFKISLLGHKSKILSKYVFEEYVKRYHDQAKKYKEEENLLLPTEGNVSASSVSNAKIIHLQQCLLICLWNVIHQLGGTLKSSINLNDLLTLIPVHLESSDPLAHQLANRINKQLTQYSFFPKIQVKSASQSSHQSRLKQFYKPFQAQGQKPSQQKGSQQNKQKVKYYDLFV